MANHNAKVVAVLTSRGPTITPPSGLTYSTNPALYPEDSAITTNSPTVTGSVDTYSVSPSLPTGLSIHATTGAITGTPTTTTASAVYVVTATNAGGSTTCNLTIAITVVAPADVSNLLMWFKGDAGVTQVGNAVSQWDDQSGNANHVVQATAGAKPTYSASDVAFNSKPSISFDGGDALRTSGTPTFGKHTILVVFSATVNGALCGRRSASGNDIDYLTTTITRSSLVRRGGTLDGKELTADWGIGGTVRTLVRRYDGTHTGHLLRINGILQSMTSNPGNSAGTGTAAEVFSVGDESTGNPNMLTGKIAEVIVFDDDIGSTRTSAWETYLKDKYAHY